jgi:hypothetical protein
MLFHVSIEADQPRHVAEVLAEFWGGVAMPFPPVGKGSWVAFAGDDRSSLIEVYPRGTQLHPAEGPADAYGVAGEPRHFHSTHFAMATPLEIEDALAIGRRENWPIKICSRGGKFRVIELWIEGCQMVELLTAGMQREYLSAVTIANWRRMIEEGVAPQEAKGSLAA